MPKSEKINENTVKNTEVSFDTSDDKIEDLKENNKYKKPKCRANYATEKEDSEQLDS